MQQSEQQRARSHREHVGRIAAAVLAVGGLSASAVAAGAATTAAAKRVVISTAKSTIHGTILVSGTTLYTLKPSMTPCTSACLKIWPAVTLPKGAKKATAGKGVSASKLGSVKRAGGVRQVTYGGKALYWFSQDTAPGQVNGNVTDAWGTWTDVRAGPVGTLSPSAAGAPTAPPAGAAATAPATAPTTTPAIAPSGSAPSTPVATPPTTPVAPITPATSAPTSPPTTTTTTSPSSGGVAF
jgi:predicted lipoprotein with Yx(FWY)xxD motif